MRASGLGEEEAGGVGGVKSCCGGLVVAAYSRISVALRPFAVAPSFWLCTPKSMPCWHCVPCFCDGGLSSSRHWRSHSEVYSSSVHTSNEGPATRNKGIFAVSTIPKKRRGASCGRQ